MSEKFEQYLKSVKAWVVRARETGWLNQDDARMLDAIEIESALDLFEDTQRRPLIIGLFGGTGAGKSSLLNELAGEAVAQVGVERPTSRRATIYLHQDQAVTAIAQDSPIGQTDIEYHCNNDRRDVAWLDMPDIDSVEQANRDLALAWLPYIDWLVYVVSPERYRDDSGWQLLRSRHHHHHWLFVINHWDEAEGVQLHDLEGDLEAAGFEAPRILRTSCVGDDSFDLDQLDSIVTSAIRQHGLAELQRVGILARLQQLDELSNHYAQRMGNAEHWRDIRQRVGAVTHARLDLFRQRMETEIEGFVRFFPGPPALWRRDMTLNDLPDVDAEKEMWSSYADGLLGNIELDAATVVEEFDVASEPLAGAMREALADAKRTILNDMQGQLRTALTDPGTPAQRMLRRASGLLAFALPLAVSGWVGYNVVTRFQTGLSGEADFLGFDFAVHSILLISLSWFIPAVLGRWVRPSLRSCARRGLSRGLQDAVAALEQALDASVASLDRNREAMVAEFPDRPV